MGNLNILIIIIKMKYTLSIAVMALLGFN